MKFRERLALKFLAWASWCLPEGHPALTLLYEAAFSIGAVVKNRKTAD